jgi:hypothetical protein
MLALFAGSLIATLAAAQPLKAGLVLLLGTAIAAYLGTRLLELNSFFAVLALILNGFFASIFIIVGLVIGFARQALKG